MQVILQHTVHHHNKGIRVCRKKVIKKIMTKTCSEGWLEQGCGPSLFVKPRHHNWVGDRAVHHRHKLIVIQAALMGDYPYHQSFNCSQWWAGRPTYTYCWTHPLGAVYSHHMGESILVPCPKQHGIALNSTGFQISNLNPASYQLSWSQIHQLIIEDPTCLPSIRMLRPSPSKWKNEAHSDSIMMGRVLSYNQYKEKTGHGTMVCIDINLYLILFPSIHFHLHSIPFSSSIYIFFIILSHHFTAHR